MGRLVVEIRRGGEWVAMGEPLGPDLTVDLEAGNFVGGGSLSHNGPAGRQVYWFGCLGDCSVIFRSRRGVDREEGPRGEVRVITPAAGFEEIARLTPLRPHFEFWVRTDLMREPSRVRFRHEEMADG